MTDIYTDYTYDDLEVIFQSEEAPKEAEISLEEVIIDEVFS